MQKGKVKKLNTNTGGRKLQVWKFGSQDRLDRFIIKFAVKFKSRDKLIHRFLLWSYSKEASAS